ncbi:Txe/YoeB family addiction module toxin [Pedobacter sp. CFBP9032]|uniref:Txe/YoeB family addiction module toxin n=1 Tax=Pedobacter sp. CFBP9032 TaxID=3096539 RepID=UPI002A69EEFF|nr:Txe/YoeB family addiction module toxin [Pedobacter sp. CFBP9032]MDY0904918.1 Txe/YoeB family addiction module toxin [Pedobacter sp. CFBP9032]
MGKYFIEVERQAKKDLEIQYKSGDKASIKRIDQIFVELSEHPEAGIGKPEKLKYNLTGFWSRQINRKDRLIYKIEEHIVTVTIISAIGHYGDK